MALAVGVVLLVAALSWGMVLSAASQLQQVKAQHAEAQTELSSLQMLATNGTKPDFLQSLPSAVGADVLMRDIGRYAQEAGVQVGSITIDNQAPTATQLGKVHVNVSAVSEYRATKSWLAGLLQRYPSLTVGSLALQVLPNETMRQDVRLQLVWYVKD